jgi:magnesium chelatase family protein
MSLSIVHGRAQIGVEAPAVTVEVHLANGLPSLTMVGLPEAAVKESKDRVRSAIINSGLQFPARRITLNLASAGLAARKAGRWLMVPQANAEEACLASGLEVIAVDHLLQAVAHVNGHTPIEPYVSNGLLYASTPYPDLNEVQGQMVAKRALLIEAAGAHKPD